jgi:hypothetical protein
MLLNPYPPTIEKLRCIFLVDFLSENVEFINKILRIFLCKIFQSQKHIILGRHQVRAKSANEENMVRINMGD